MVGPHLVTDCSQHCPQLRRYCIQHAARSQYSHWHVRGLHVRKRGSQRFHPPLQRPGRLLPSCVQHAVMSHVMQHHRLHTVVCCKLLQIGIGMGSRNEGKAKQRDTCGGIEMMIEMIDGTAWKRVHRCMTCIDIHMRQVRGIELPIG